MLVKNMSGLAVAMVVPTEKSFGITKIFQRLANTFKHVRNVLLTRREPITNVLEKGCKFNFIHRSLQRCVRTASMARYGLSINCTI